MSNAVSEMLAVKSTRVAPVSVVHNIVDFLMFFFSTSAADDAATHEFIKAHVRNAGEQVDQRYKDFYRIVAYIIQVTNWNQEEWVDLLDDINALETKYGENGSVKNAGISKHKWQNIKMELIFQMGLSILRANLNMSAATVGEDITIPPDFQLENYHESIETLFRDYRKLYVIDANAREVHHKFQQHQDALTTDLYVEKEVTTKVGRGKKRTLVKTLDADEVHALLTQHVPAATVAMLVAFVQQLETKVLPVPIDVGITYVGVDEQDIHGVLRAAAKKRGGIVPAAAATTSSSSSSSGPLPNPAASVAAGASTTNGSSSAGASGSSGRKAPQAPARRQEDWTDDQADAFGPYVPSPTAPAAPAPGGKGRGGRPPGKTGKNSRVLREEAHSSDGADASPTTETQGKRGAPESPPNLPVSPARSGRKPTAAPAAATAPASASAAAAVAANAAAALAKVAALPADEPGSVLAAANRLKRKYEDRDPLNEALGDGAAAQRPVVRVSRESLLGSSSAARPSGGSASKPAAVASSRIDNGPSARGLRVDFDDGGAEAMESVEEDDEDDSRVLVKKGRTSTGSIGGPSRAGAILMNLKNAPTASAAFPDRLESPEHRKKQANKKKTNGAAANHGDADGDGYDVSMRRDKKQHRVRWTFEEEEALREAVGRYGEGNWMEMLNDPDYGNVLKGRTNVNLKDKWRNLLKSV